MRLADQACTSFSSKRPYLFFYLVSPATTWYSLPLLLPRLPPSHRAVPTPQELLKKEAAVTQAAAGEIGGGGADGSASDELDEPFEAPGDDEAAVPEMELVPAGERGLGF